MIDVKDDVELLRLKLQALEAEFQKAKADIEARLKVLEENVGLKKSAEKTSAEEE